MPTRGADPDTFYTDLRVKRRKSKTSPFIRYMTLLKLILL